MFEAIRRLLQPARPAAPSTVDWKKQGNDSLARGELSEAVRCYRRAAEADPNDAAARLSLGYALLSSKSSTRPASPCARCSACSRTSTKPTSCSDAPSGLPAGWRRRCNAMRGHSSAIRGSTWHWRNGARPAWSSASAA